jgi:hypothetical protein
MRAYRIKLHNPQCWSLSLSFGGGGGRLAGGGDGRNGEEGGCVEGLSGDWPGGSGGLNFGAKGDDGGVVGFTDGRGSGACLVTGGTVGALGGVETAGVDAGFTGADVMDGVTAGRLKPGAATAGRVALAAGAAADLGATGWTGGALKDATRGCFGAPPGAATSFLPRCKATC